MLSALLCRRQFFFCFKLWPRLKQIFCFAVKYTLLFGTRHFNRLLFCHQGGVLVAVIHGARTPEIQRTVTEQLKQEHKVQEGLAERKEVR